MNTRALRTSMSVLALTLFAGASVAGTNHFNNASGDQNWMNAANWSLGHVPNVNDDAIIDPNKVVTLPAGNSVNVKSLDIYGWLYQNGNIQVENGINVTQVGTVSMYKTGATSPQLLIRGQGVINGVFNLFGGYIGDVSTTDSTGTLRVSSTGTLNSYSNISAFGAMAINFTNEGLMAMYGDAIGFNSNGNLTRGYVNLGEMRFLAPCRIFKGAVGSVYLASDGVISLYGAGACKIEASVPVFTGSISTMIAQQSTLQIDNLATLGNNGTLNGHWYCYAGGQFSTPNNTAATIAAGANVSLSGAGAAFDAIRFCNLVQGGLSVSEGAELSLYPPQLGTVVNDAGYVHVGPSGHLYIQGSFWEKPGGTLVRDFTSTDDVAMGRFEVLLSSTVQGSLAAYFNLSETVSPGDAFDVIEMAPNACCGVFGGFSSVQIFNAPVAMEVQFTGDKVVIVPSCTADFNGDGFLNGDDFDGYVAAFELGDQSADYLGDGFVNGDDFDAYVAAFEIGC